jgi:hypothetical protein
VIGKLLADLAAPPYRTPSHLYPSGSHSYGPRRRSVGRGKLVYETTPLMEEMTSLAPFREALKKESELRARIHPHVKLR